MRVTAALHYDALFVTPLRIREYYASRVISLSALALLVSSTIVIFSRGLPENIFVFLISVFLASALFTLFGMAIGSKTKTVNSYFIVSVGYTIILALPILNFLHLVTSKIFLVIPTSSVLFLMRASLLGGDPLHITAHISYLLLWNVVIALWAWKRFKRYVIYGIGGTK
jgi:fluoroquinolone transport system permease protein